MNLNQTILDAARDEVARKREYMDYETFLHGCTLSGLTVTLSEFEYEAALLAMEKQAEFFRHISSEGWHYVSSEGYWFSMDLCGKTLTELELYEIWKGQKL